VGVATIEQEKIMIISPQSPIGTLLMGKVKGDTFSFRGKESVIEEVL
jgi:transcription elongation GreA/GreB family factor